MLRIAKMTDYAFVVLQKLCERDEESLSAQKLSQITGLGEPTVSKVLKMLSKAELVKSVRGAGGGYSAIKTTQDITVLDVIEAVEGDVSFVACVDETHDCIISQNCPLQGRWDPINDAIRKTLQDWTLADLSQNQKQFLKQVGSGA